MSSAPGLAATFDELYTVSVRPEEAVGAADRRTDAIRRGMGILLTRITGRQQAEAYPELRQLISDADRYLTSYAFVSGDEVRVGFNRNLVNQALTRLNMPIWGDERPLTLLWLATDLGNGQRAELMAGDDDAAAVASNPLSDEAAEFFDQIASEILTAADERGIPVVLPELDAIDRRSVRFADVWGGYDEFVARAAERYQADAVLIAAVSMTEFGPDVRWTVRRGDQRQTLLTPRARLGVDWLADEFASEFTTTGDVRLTSVRLREIRDWSDYLSLLNFLESISIIESFSTESLERGELVLSVTARGDDNQLGRYLTLDGRLLPVEDEAGLVFVPSWNAEPDLPDTP